MAFDSATDVGVAQNIEQLQRIYYKELAESRLIQNWALYPLGKHEKLPRQAGASFMFNRWGNVSGTTATLNEDTVTGGQTALTANTATLTLAPYGQFAKITEFANMTNRREVTKDATLILADAASDTVDLLIRTELNANAGSYIGASGASTTASITTADIMSPTVVRRLVAKQQSAKVRPYRDGMAYAGVFHPFQMYDLMSDTSVGGFLATAQYAQPNKIWNGEQGKLMGLRLIQSQNIVTVSVTTGVTAYTGFMMGEGAFSCVSLADSPIDIIVNEPGSAGAADPYRNISTVAYKMYFGAKYLSGSVLADAGSANRALKVITAVSFNG
jgi:N4-gp56 family major capsid protein